MSSNRASRFLPAVTLLLLAPAVRAHHAATGLYEQDASGTVSGEIEAVFWRNPHVRLTIVTQTESGPETWQIEAGSVNTLERLGITADMFAVGGSIEISGRPGRNGRKIMFANTFALPDEGGQSLGLGADINERYARPEQIARGRAIDSGPASDIFRVWVPAQVPNTGAGRAEFPLTDSARAARASWNAADDPALRCIAPGMPAAMDNPYPISFEDAGDRIIMRLEEWDGLRTIHMQPAADLDETPPSPMGYSVGRWDGDTLIVETSRISWPFLDDLGTPQSSKSRITERFTLHADERRLSWLGRIEDPENLTEALELNIEWRWIPGHEIKAFNCALPG